MFVRFVVGSDGEHHRELTGIVTEARFLRDAGRLSAEEAAQLEESYNWLNDHLPVPAVLHEVLAARCCCLVQG